MRCDCCRAGSRSSAFGFTLSLNIALGALVLLPLVYTVLGAYPFVETLGHR